MKLLYIYIKDYKCFYNQEFNFDSRWRFHLQQKNGLFYLECKENSSFPNNFFSLEKDERNPISSISAIVGNNGSGKTSIAKFLDEILLNTNFVLEHIIIFEIESRKQGEKKLICRYNLLRKITSNMLLNHCKENGNHIKPCLNNKQSPVRFAMNQKGHMESIV